MRLSAKAITLSVGFGLAVLFLWLAVRHVDFSTVWSIMLGANLWLVVPYVASLSLFFWLKARRWGSILNPADPVSAGRLLPSMMVGYAGNNVLPLRLGELIRIYLAGRDLAVPKSLVLATLVFERFLDTIAILLMLAGAMYWLAADSPELHSAGLFLFAITGLAAISIYGIVHTPRWLAAAVGPIFRRLPEFVLSTIKPRFQHLRDGFSILHNVTLLAPLLLNSLLQWMLLSACIYVSIAAFHLPVSPLAAVIVMGLVVAGISLPGAPGFVGTIEYCFVLGLGFFDVAAEHALSIAIFYHVLMFVCVGSTGAWFLRHYGTSWRKLSKNVHEIRSA